MYIQLIKQLPTAARQEENVYRGTLPTKTPPPSDRLFVALWAMYLKYLLSFFPLPSSLPSLLLSFPGFSSVVISFRHSGHIS